MFVPKLKMDASYSQIRRDANNKAREYLKKIPKEQETTQPEHQVPIPVSKYHVEHKLSEKEELEIQKAKFFAVSSSQSSESSQPLQTSECSQSSQSSQTSESSKSSQLPQQNKNINWTQMNRFKRCKILVEKQKLCNAK
jgi:hypothetical protein